MLIVIAYYIVLFFVVVPYGIALERMVRVKDNHPVITLLLGLFSLSLGFTIFSFFHPLSLRSFGIVLLVALVLYLLLRNDIKRFFEKLKELLVGFSLFYKRLLGVLIVFISIRSAGLPFVLDNESYYVQTIKWLNEYGLVKGLANLHIFLGQNSGWHILQAGLNFNFLTDRINDINGFVFIVCLFYFLDIYQRHNERAWLGFILIANVLLFQFVDSPSPDLPIILISQVVFHLFLSSKPNYTNTNVLILTVLFLVFIKLTALPFVLLLVFWKKDYQFWSFFVVSGLGVGLIWVVKNCIVTGCPFYPFDNLCMKFEWSVPAELFEFITPPTAVSNALIGGVLIAGIGLVVLRLRAVSFYRTNTKTIFLFVGLFVHTVTVLLFSPQIRFLLPELIFGMAFLVNFILKYFEVSVSRLIILSSSLLPIIFMFPIPLTLLTDNPYHSISGSFSLSQIVYPSSATKFYEMNFDKKVKGNLPYFSPEKNFFMFGTSNGDLPCVNETYIDYFETFYNVYPQMRSKDIEDGFFSKRASE